MTLLKSMGPPIGVRTRSAFVLVGMVKERADTVCCPHFNPRSWHTHYSSKQSDWNRSSGLRGISRFSILEFSGWSWRDSNRLTGRLAWPPVPYVAAPSTEESQIATGRPDLSVFKTTHLGTQLGKSLIFEATEDEITIPVNNLQDHCDPSGSLPDRDPDGANHQVVGKSTHNTPGRGA